MEGDKKNKKTKKQKNKKISSLYQEKYAYCIFFLIKG
jgi:hypothetical protein